MKINAKIEIEVRDQSGKIIQKHEQESKSWVANFLRALRGLMYDDMDSRVESVTDTDGQSRPFPDLNTVGYPAMQVTAGEGEDRFGILVGTGTKAVEPEDFNLESKITNGTASGQMLYGATTLENVGISGNTIILRIIRTFSNNSGSSIIVREIGLAAQARCDTAGRLIYYLIARDVLASEVSVPDGLTLTVRYVISVTV